MRGKLLSIPLVVSLFALSVGARAQENAAANKDGAEQRAERYLDSIRRQPLLLDAFLRRMPKGGDLHNHLVGAVYAESFIAWAAEDGLCVDRTSLALAPPPCDAAGRPEASQALVDPVLYREMVDAFSMRNWRPERGSGHDHFFDTFLKFEPATSGREGDMLAEVASRAAAEGVLYQELMLGPGNGQAIALGSKTGWQEDFAQLRRKLLAQGLPEMVAGGRRLLDAAEARRNERLRCQAADADAGCHVTQRYLYQVLRGLAPEQVFAQILAGFEMAQADARVVGLNLVMAEDWYVPRRDFLLHMRMLDFLHRIYPKVHISLHAGELAPGLEPPEDLKFHIRESVERGHAERVGHGVDVMYERDPLELLRQMAERKVLVEICLTSNDVILGVRGEHHPLPLYRRYGVPVALATDDEGVSRSDMTAEFRRAVETYGLSYRDLKSLARNSLEYSFLPGASLWTDPRSFRKAPACAADIPAGPRLSSACRRWLDSSEKARLQWKLETDFAGFEKSLEKKVDTLAASGR